MSAIAGFGTVAIAIKGSPLATMIAGSVVGVTAALDLVLDFSSRARAYDDLYRKFADLGIKVAAAEHTEENYRRFVVERRSIEKDEPTVLIVLNAICYNEELKSRGYDYSYKIGWFQKVLCQCFDIGGSKIEATQTSG